MICCLIVRFVRHGFVSPYALLPLALDNNPLGRAFPREGLPFLGAQEFLAHQAEEPHRLCHNGRPGATIDKEHAGGVERAALVEEAQRHSVGAGV